MDSKEIAKALDRTVNYETYIANMNNAELISVIIRLENFDEVTSALTELFIRNKEIVEPYCLKILEEDLGDEFLQAVAFNLLYEVDHEKANEMINKKLEGAPAAVLGAIMDKLSVDSLQPFGESLSSDFLKSIVGRYLELCDDDKKRILENYEWFKESYEDKLKDGITG